MTLSSGCNQPRVGLLTKLPCRVHSSPPSWPPSTRVFLPQLSLFISWGQRARGPTETGLVPAGAMGSAGASSRRGLAEKPRRLRRLAGLANFRFAILGKKEQRVVGESSEPEERSAGRAGLGGAEDGEPEEPGEAEEPGTSSREDKDADSRRWLYLVRGSRSMVAGSRPHGPGEGGCYTGATAPIAPIVSLPRLAAALPCPHGDRGQRSRPGPAQGRPRTLAAPSGPPLPGRAVLTHRRAETGREQEAGLSHPEHPHSCLLLGEGEAGPAPTYC